MAKISFLLTTDQRIAPSRLTARHHSCFLHHHATSSALRYLQSKLWLDLAGLSYRLLQQLVVQYVFRFCYDFKVIFRIRNLFDFILFKWINRDFGTVLVCLLIPSPEWHLWKFKRGLWSYCSKCVRLPSRRWKLYSIAYAGLSPNIYIH